MEEVTKNKDNVNQILESVNDKLIAKKKLKRTIISSVILSIIVVLSAIVISLASIHVDLYPQFLRNADRYEINMSGYNYTRHIDEDSEIYQDYLNTINSQFSESILSAMFTGKLSGYTIEESNTSFYSDNSAKTGMTTSLSNLVGNNYIHLVFNQEQSVTDGKGNQYYSTNYKKDDFELKFKDCYLKLDSESSTTTFYVGTYDPDWGKAATITTIIVQASSSDLYDCLAGLFKLKSST